MELSFSELRVKEVVNVQDGRKLGKVCDVVLCYPDNRWPGIVVPGGRGFLRRKNELFIELRNIVKIGEDVILVNVGYPRAQKCDKRNHGMPISVQTAQNSGGSNGGFGRNFEEYE